MHLAGDKGEGICDAINKRWFPGRTSPLCPSRSASSATTQPQPALPDLGWARLPCALPAAAPAAVDPSRGCCSREENTRDSDASSLSLSRSLSMRVRVDPVAR